MYDFIDTLADAVGGGTMIPVSVEALRSFTKSEELYTGRDAPNAFAYGIMDTATRIKRSDKELAGAWRAYTKKGFTQGRRVMQKHMYSTKARSTTHLKGALEALAAQPDRKRTMRIIFKALRDVYRSRPPLADRYLGAIHHCAHNFRR